MEILRGIFKIFSEAGRCIKTRPLHHLVFSAAAACIFVSKREVKSWPGVGWKAGIRFLGKNAADPCRVCPANAAGWHTPPALPYRLTLINPLV